MHAEIHPLRPPPVPAALSRTIVPYADGEPTGFEFTDPGLGSMSVGTWPTRVPVPRSGWLRLAETAITAAAAVLITGIIATAATLMVASATAAILL